MLLFFIPPITAYAASTTSKSFVVRNWKATPTSSDEVEQEELENEEPGEEAAETCDRSNTVISETENDEQEEQAGEIEPEPSDEDISAVPLGSTTPASTEDVETVEPEGEEQGEFVEEEPPVPASSVFTDEGEKGEKGGEMK